MEKVDKKIKEVVKYVYDNVPSYKVKMDEIGVSPNDINGVEDLKWLPFRSEEHTSELQSQR